MKLIIYLSFFAALTFMQGCATKPLSETEMEQADAKLAARAITVQGKAAINKGTKLLARKLAFRDAIRNVSVKAGSRFSSEFIIGSTKVVDEWVADNIYYVQVLAVLSESKNLSCNAPYRKKMIVTGFPGVVSGQISANETQDLYSGIPREMMNILLESGNFIGKNETHTVLYSRPDMAPEIIDETGYQESAVIQMAQEQGAQFVLSGVIRDFEVESTEYIRGAGLFAQLKSVMRDFTARRGIAIDVYVHDGISGALLFQHRYTDTVLGDVWIPSGYAVGSERFKSTPAGHKISQIIQLASKDIGRLFSCYPFVTKVLKAENDKVYIAAGSQDKLKLGDSLVVYGLKGSPSMQVNEIIGVINIQNVQANFSVGKMELASDVRKIKAGDLVKSW